LNLPVLQFVKDGSLPYKLHFLYEHISPSAFGLLLKNVLFEEPQKAVLQVVVVSPCSFQFLVVAYLRQYHGFFEVCQSFLLDLCLVEPYRRDHGCTHKVPFSQVKRDQPFVLVGLDEMLSRLE